MKIVARGSMIMIAIIIIAAVYAIISSSDSTYVYFDNGMNEKVTVKIPSEEPVTINAHDIYKKELKAGKYKIEIYDSKNKLVEKSELDCQKEKNKSIVTQYIYNIKTLNKYSIFTMPYGNAKVTDPIQKVSGGHFFLSPVVYKKNSMDLCEAFSSKVYLDRGQKGGTRMVLGHENVFEHKTFPCCKKLWNSFDKK